MRFASRRGACGSKQPRLNMTTKPIRVDQPAIPIPRSFAAAWSADGHLAVLSNTVHRIGPLAWSRDGAPKSAISQDATRVLRVRPSTYEGLLLQLALVGQAHAEADRIAHLREATVLRRQQRPRTRSRSTASAGSSGSSKAGRHKRASHSYAASTLLRELDSENPLLMPGANVRESNSVGGQSPPNAGWGHGAQSLSASARSSVDDAIRESPCLVRHSDIETPFCAKDSGSDSSECTEKSGRTRASQNSGGSGRGSRESSYVPRNRRRNVRHTRGRGTSSDDGAGEWASSPPSSRPGWRTRLHGALPDAGQSTSWLAVTKGSTSDSECDGNTGSAEDVGKLSFDVVDRCETQTHLFASATATSLAPAGGATQPHLQLSVADDITDVLGPQAATGATGLSQTTSKQPLVAPFSALTAFALKTDTRMSERRAVRNAGAWDGSAYSSSASSDSGDAAHDNDAFGDSFGWGLLDGDALLRGDPVGLGQDAMRLRRRRASGRNGPDVSRRDSLGSEGSGRERAAFDRYADLLPLANRPSLGVAARVTLVSLHGALPPVDARVSESYNGKQYSPTGVNLPPDPVCAALGDVVGALPHDTIAHARCLPDVCGANAVAAAQRNPRAAQAWQVTAAAFSGVVFEDYSVRQLGSVWGPHPLGSAMLSHIYRHLDRLGDVQTLGAMAVAVNMRCGDTAYQAASTAGVSELVQDGSDCSGLARVYLEAQAGSVSLLDERICRPEVALSSYADALYRRGEMLARALVLKEGSPLGPGFVGADGEGASSVAIAPSVTGGGLSLEMRLLCSSCGEDGPCACGREPRGLTCSVCLLPVRSLATLCPACGHGGHAIHCAEHFARSRECATGCGCSCQEQMARLAATDDAPDPSNQLSAWLSGVSRRALDGPSVLSSQPPTPVTVSALAPADEVAAASATAAAAAHAFLSVSEWAEEEALLAGSHAGRAR